MTEILRHAAQYIVLASIIPVAWACPALMTVFEVWWSFRGGHDAFSRWTRRHAPFGLAESDPR